MTDDTDRSGPGRSRREIAIALAAVAAGQTAGPALAAAQDATPAAGELPPDFQVVFHVSEGAHWEYTLANVDNLQHNWPLARLRVVVDGFGVYALQGDTDIVRRLAPFAAKGLDLQVCPNALREHGIPAAAMPPFASTQLGGVAALVLANREGYVYIKP